MPTPRYDRPIGHTPRDIAVVFVDVVVRNYEKAVESGYGIIGAAFIAREINRRLGTDLTQESVSRYSRLAVKISGEMYHGKRVLGNPKDGWRLVSGLNTQDIKTNVVAPLRGCVTKMDRVADTLDVEDATLMHQNMREEIQCLEELTDGIVMDALRQIDEDENHANGEG
jgi:hypothetical protein